MRLGEFLDQAGDAPATTRPVKFKIVGRDAMGARKKVEVSAVLVYVDEHERQKAMRDALAEMRKQFDGDIPIERKSEEEVYQTLFLALRDEDDLRKQFALSVTELRAALVEPVAGELYAIYLQFMQEEFPPVVSQDEFAKLVEEAKVKSLAELLSSGSSSQIRRALPGLVALFAK